MKIRRGILISLLSIASLLVAIWISIRPSNNRDWTTDQQVLPEVNIEGSLVHIKNIRNFTYRSPDDYTPGYYDKTFDLQKIKAVYYIVEPFSDFKGAAHTFVSFEFEGNQFIAISVEIRKEKGESFSAIKGLLKQYELMYVVADERDVIKLRSNYRHDDVFVYPIKASKEGITDMFVSMLQRADNLRTNPEFYNSLFNTCTTNIASHVNKVRPGKIPFNPRLLLPGYSDALAYQLGLIDTNLSFADTRNTFHINDRALRYADDKNFSVKIRQPYREYGRIPK